MNDKPSIKVVGRLDEYIREGRPHIGAIPVWIDTTEFGGGFSRTVLAGFDLDADLPTIEGAIPNMDDYR